MSVRKQSQPSLNVERLETREVPAILSMHSVGGILFIQGDNTASKISLEKVNGNLVVTDDDADTFGLTQNMGSINKFVGVRFNGGSGNDTLANHTDRFLLAYGNGGDDILIGGSGNDRLYGGSGNDQLFGAGGNDSLFGQSGIDRLYGGTGSDFLDAGSVLSANVGEVVSGGDGVDFDAYHVANDGATLNDIRQTGTPTCWVLSSISAAAQSGIDLSKRITYLGDGLYDVKLLRVNQPPLHEKVSLNGGRLSFEPMPSDGTESWVLLTHRALMQARGVDWHNAAAYSGGFPADVLPYLTGRKADSHDAPWFKLGSFGLSDLNAIDTALKAHKAVCACTRPGDANTFNAFGTVSTAKLVGEHCYTVVSINWSKQQITVRNPWGYDGGKVASGDANDALVTLSFHQFYGSFMNYAIS